MWGRYISGNDALGLVASGDWGAPVVVGLVDKGDVDDLWLRLKIAHSSANVDRLHEPRVLMNRNKSWPIGTG